MKKNYKYLQILLLIVSFLPAIFLGKLIIKYGVNVPFFDQWGVARYINKYFTSGLTFTDLLAQHNETRPFFPRIVFISLASLTHWDVRYEMLVIFLMACFISFNLYRLNRLTIGGMLFKVILICLLFNLLIFSPVQYENWLWGFQIVIFIPMLCITSCILIAYSQLSSKGKFLTCMSLATISTFSLANGLLCWLVVFPVLALNTWKDLSKEKWLVTGWIAGFTLNAALYFYGYQKPPHHPGIWDGAVHLQAAIDYFFGFCGSGFAFGNFNLAKNVGMVLFSIFIAVCIYLIKYRKNFILWHRTIGWLMIATYSISSGLITTLGRVGFGVEQSMAPRYTTFSLYLPISLVALVAIIIDDAARKSRFSNLKLLVYLISLIAIIYLLFLELISVNMAVKEMNNWRVERLQGKSCLLFINIVKEEECLATRVNPKIARVKFLANRLNSLGYLQPGLIKSSRIQNIEGSKVNTADGYGYGWFDGVSKVSNDEYVTSGWARLPDREEPADAVILTYEKANNHDTAFALIYTRIKREDVAKVTPKDAYSMSGWQKSFSASKLPKGQVKINAWAFDANTGKAFKLNGTQIVQNL
ncbi:hypothetical protein ACE1CD_32035 [Aerosakkonema sp. BLCC-F183]|uniref:hypothetical protein n=1 Tax=Aerosakkonema sp. BLCC-F183 TaxID=3342834 RepID=UPI0035B7F528